MTSLMNCILCGSLDNGTIINGELVCSECMGNHASEEDLKKAVEKAKKEKYGH